MATELAKAYVQIVPSAKGIKGSISGVLDGEASSAGENAGKSLGSSMVSKIKAIIVAAGIGKAFQQSLTQGAALQQSLGGVETLFKESADKVVKNAQSAYKTAGMSANQYMEMVTGFSASLLQGLSGDTNKAADVADMALKDMSDNANKMGTSMELIQNAYQGFAKQNYTMLDNLKLGYGGTKTEMERLLAKAQELTGVKYDINNLSDVYEAIHAIQKDMGITGTTTSEASKTFSGSLASMKAAANDFLGNIALGQNVTSSLMALGQTISTFVMNNLVPMIGNVFNSMGSVLSQYGGTMITAGVDMITNLISGISSKLPDIIPQALKTVLTMVSSITANLPKLVKAGIEMLKGLVQGIINSLPTLIAEAPRVINDFADGIYSAIGTIIKAGLKLIVSLVKGIWDNRQLIVQNAGQILLAFINAFSLAKIASLGKSLTKSLKSGIESLKSNIAQAGKDLLKNLVSGIKALASNPVSALKSIGTKAISAFKSLNWKGIGSNIISGIVNGIKAGAGKILTSLKNLAKNALNAAKNALGIKSPSRIFRDQVGEMIDAGMAAGIEENAKSVVNAMKEVSDATVSAVDTDFSFASTKSYNWEKNSNNNTMLEQMYALLKNMLPQIANMQMVLDTGVMVGELTPGINSNLNILLSNCERGM